MEEWKQLLRDGINTAKDLKERFGIEGSKDAQLKKDIGNWKNKYQNMDNSQLRAQMSQGQEYQRLAAREILQSRNQLSHAEQTQTYDLYAKNNRISAEKFAEGLNYGNMSSATVGFALEHLMSSQTLVPGDKVVMVMLGAGFTAQAASHRP